MRWHGDVLIFQSNGDGCTASYGGGEVTPTEDNYGDKTTSTKEYEPGTCCVASVKSLEESCRALPGSNAPPCPKSRFPLS